LGCLKERNFLINTKAIDKFGLKLKNPAREQQQVQKVIFNNIEQGTRNFEFRSWLSGQYSAFLVPWQRRIFSVTCLCCLIFYTGAANSIMVCPLLKQRYE